VCHQRDHIPVIGGAADEVPIYAIEFDDQGAMWEPNQLARTIEAIRGFGNQHVVVITFVHGWKHDARSDDENLLAFEQQLKTRATLEKDWAKSMSQPTRPLLGVYIGWRGESVSFDPWIMSNLTFWSRKSTAARVGSTALTEAIFSIARVTKDQDSDAQVVFIGHSFGGAIVERAMAQALVALLNEPERARATNGKLAPAVDLAVLVNPASPALEAYLLADTLMRRQVYVRKEGSSGDRAEGEDEFGPPLIVSVTASNDWATGEAFPLGQYPISWTKAFADTQKDLPGERALFTHTAGHVPKLFSHTLARVTGDGPLVFKTPEGTAYQIQRLDDSWNKSPYWIMEAPSDVIDGHNGIFNDVFADLLETILDASLVSPHAGTLATRIQANPGTPRQ